MRHFNAVRNIAEFATQLFGNTLQLIIVKVYNNNKNEYRRNNHLSKSGRQH